MPRAVLKTQRGQNPRDRTQSSLSRERVVSLKTANGFSKGPRTMPENDNGSIEWNYQNEGMSNFFRLCVRLQQWPRRCAILALLDFTGEVKRDNTYSAGGSILLRRQRV